jgi:hypothetical protein
MINNFIHPLPSLKMDILNGGRGWKPQGFSNLRMTKASMTRWRRRTYKLPETSMKLFHLAYFESISTKRSAVARRLHTRWSRGSRRRRNSFQKSN